jgi:hypothetical protein
MVIVGDVEDVVKFLARKEDELETLLYFTQYIKAFRRTMQTLH